MIKVRSSFYRVPTTTTIKDTWAEIDRSTQHKWAASAWTIWKERNRRIFQGEAKNLHALKIELASYTMQWELHLGTTVRSRNRATSNNS
jgi:hypothetical protein